VRYGVGNVWGYESEDQVCLNTANSCVDHVGMMGVIRTTKLDNLKADGVVGLSPEINDIPNSLISLLFS